MAYIGTSPTQGVRRIYNYTATASQTSFSGNDTLGISLAYADGAYIDVYQNGVLLIPTDYVATTGTTVVLDTGAAVNDTVQMVVYDVFSVGDSVSQSAGGNFAGNVGMGETLAVTGVPTFTGRSVHSGGITIANAGQIGSVGDADAMAISSSGVVTFSQTPVGAGGLQLLFSQATADNAASIDIDATYINSTYDSYYVVGNMRPVDDAIQCYLKLKSSGSIVTGSKHGYDLTNLGDGIALDAGDFIKLNRSTVGNAIGEGVQFNFFMHNVNSTIYPCHISAFWRQAFTSGVPEGGITSGGFISTAYALVCNGFNISASAGDIDTHSIKVYGVV
jgi:hypothetical protein